MRFLLLLFLLNCIPFKMRAIELRITVDSVGNSTSCVKGKFHGSICVQQFKWNRWVTVDTLAMNLLLNDTCFERRFFLHSGENQFRLEALFTNPFVTTCYSKVAKTHNSDTLVRCGTEGPCGSFITFHQVTHWELYDRAGTFLSAGVSQRVQFSGLAKGAFIIYYDNCSAEFYKN